MRTAAAARTILHRFGNRQHIHGSLGNFRLAAYPLSLRSIYACRQITVDDPEISLDPILYERDELRYSDAVSETREYNIDFM